MRRIESKKLNLNKETLRTLTGPELTEVAGGSLGSIGGSVIQVSAGRGGCVTVPDTDTEGHPSRDGVCINPLPNPSIVILPGEHRVVFGG
jgi:hypothetical protein